LPIKGIGVEDIAWFLPNGSEMTEEHWNQDFAQSLAVYFSGVGLHSVGPKGERVFDDSFYVIFNASHLPLDYRLPPKKYGDNWTKILDTSEDKVNEELGKYKDEDYIRVEGRSVVLLQHPII
jgi:glycogen operon protein